MYGGRDYTVGEVLFLLSLSRKDAIDVDASQPDSCARFTEDGFNPPTAGDEDTPVMTIARWHDVQAAKQRVGLGRREQLLIYMRVLEFTEREIAEFLGLSQAMTHRRWRASLDEIMLELGGAAVDPERTSSVSACLHCHERPRARVAERRKRVRGGWKITHPERQSSLCRECTPEEQRPSLVGYVPPADTDQVDGAA